MNYTLKSKDGEMTIFLAKASKGRWTLVIWSQGQLVTNEVLEMTDEEAKIMAENFKTGLSN